MYKKSVATVVPALFAAAVLASTSAYAYHKVSIGGTVSRGELLKDCEAIGGACGNCRGTTGDYSCTNTNTPAGQETNVICSSGGKCNGYVPRQSNPPHTISGILHPPSGVKTTGGAKSPKHGMRPIKVGPSKAGIYRSHPTDSGGKGLAGSRSAGPSFPKSAEHHESMHR